MKSIAKLAVVAASCLTLATPALAQRGYDNRGAQAAEARFEAAQQRFDREYDLFQQEIQRYQESRRNGWGNQGNNDPRYNDPRYNNGRWDDRDEGNYDPARYYRDNPRYRERVLAEDERVYRGQDGRYYCKRSDGTTGLIVGGVAGGALGNVIDGGHSRTAGTLIGALVGAVAGQAVQRNNEEIRCR